MGGLPRAPLRKLHDQVVTVGLRVRRAVDATITRRGHRVGKGAGEPCGSSEEKGRLGAACSGAWARCTAHAIAFPVCAVPAALPGLRRERVPASPAVRRSEPLAGAEGGRYQVRWCLLQPTPPGIEWAHDGAR